MLPVFPLLREPLEVDPTDGDAVRAWLLDEVATQVRHAGQPIPRLVFVGDFGCEVLELDGVAKQDPGAHVGATLRALAARPGVERAYLTMRLIATDGEGVEHEAALVIEAVDEEGLTRWWTATLPFETVAATGLGRPHLPWQLEPDSDPDGWPAFLRQMLLAGPGARAARVLPARAREPDIRAAFGALPDHIPLPTDALGQSDLTAAMVAAEICREGLDGVIVLRMCGHAWEQWVLGDGMPAGIDDMIRYVCHRDPTADAVALVQLALFDGDDIPGIQIVAERAGGRAERRLLLEFPAGPTGPKRVGRVMARALPAPPEGEGWLGVEPLVNFELGPLGVVES